jgi:uncharacterized phage protein (TIGR01671 family)
VNREIKFRAWAIKTNEWINTFHIILGTINKGLDYVVMQQYTGLKDNNRREIYEGDIFSHKYYTGRYLTNNEFLENRNEPPNVTPGLCVSFTCESSWEEIDTDKIKIPEFYEYLYEIKESCGYETIQEVCDHIEIIGNIYENPDLLEQSDDI